MNLQTLCTRSTHPLRLNLHCSSLATPFPHNSAPRMARQFPPTSPPQILCSPTTSRFQDPHRKAGVYAAPRRQLSLYSLRYPLLGVSFTPFPFPSLSFALPRPPTAPRNPTNTLVYIFYIPFTSSLLLTIFMPYRIPGVCHMHSRSRKTSRRA
ncbi:hypothetical protein B0H14DRAFT_764055 [Mycena olivaceomarginata]|nr:hypothetical protein B0H14DRAFT_764055 [Mycena olivaceomarginata]